jgi:hypothetical protein
MESIDTIGSFAQPFSRFRPTIVPGAFLKNATRRILRPERPEIQAESLVILERTFHSNQLRLSNTRNIYNYFDKYNEYLE